MRIAARQVSQAGSLIETVLSAAWVMALLIGIVHLVALVWWAIALPLANAEMQRQVLSSMSLIQLAVDPPAIGVLTDVAYFGIAEETKVDAARWLLPAASAQWRQTELKTGRLKFRCLMLKDRQGFLKLGCRTDWATPFGWDLERSDWISQRPGGEDERFSGNFMK